MLSTPCLVSSKHSTLMRSSQHFCISAAHICFSASAAPATCSTFVVRQQSSTH